MDLVGGYPFWLIRDGLPYSYPPLEHSIETDVVIMGGGIASALMVWQLVNAGIPCVVVDSRTIGLGSTCANTSLLQYELDVPLFQLAKKKGTHIAVAAYQLCEQAIASIGKIHEEVGCSSFEAKQSIFFAARKKHIPTLQKEFEIRRRHGFDVSWLDEAALQAQYGFSAPGAILSASAAQTNTYAFTHALHQQAIKKGAQVYDRTAITGIDEQENAVLLTTGNGCKIKARKLVYANGYEAVNYIKKKIVRLRSTYATVSEPFSQQADFMKDNAVMWNTDDPYLYMRTTKDRRIIAGGRDEDFYDPEKRDKLIGKKSKQLKKDVEGLFPQLAFKPEFSWAGTFGSTDDGMPYIGCLPGRPNAYFALGFGGNGITFSQVAAEMITELISKGKCMYSGIFSFERE